MKIYFKRGKDGLVNDEFTYSKFGFKTFQIVGSEGVPANSKISFNEVKRIAEEQNKDVFVLNETPEAMIAKIIDMQKFLYELKKAKKESEKKQKASIQKIKEIKFHVNIADNDLKTKIDHAKKFLEENCKVKIVLELRGREVGMKDYAEEIWNKIIANFSEYEVSAVKMVNNSYFTFITK